MYVARSIARAGGWSDPPVDTVTLDYESRYRRRIVLHCDSGREILLELPAAVLLHDGDALLTPAGPVAVRSAAEPLVQFELVSTAACVRLAWHLGNRHVPTQLGERTLRIRPDHVLEGLAHGLGARVRHIEAPFEPESGAYDAGHMHAGKPDDSRRA